MVASVRWFLASKGTNEGCDRRPAIEDVSFFRNGEECEIYRILVGFLRCQCAGEQHFGFRRVLQRLGKQPVCARRGRNLI
jgi:hypothetical protein